jgi:hypothetical protein
METRFAWTLALVTLLLTPGLAMAQTNTDPPDINPAAEPKRGGQQLSGTTGEWEFPPLTTPSYAFQWRRCDATISTCENIDQATSQTYTLVAADVGNRIMLRVTADCDNPILCSPSSADSAPTGVVQAAVNTALPTIAISGSTLTASTGEWTSEAPLSFAYRWRRCDDETPGSCTSIAGDAGDDQTYTLDPADVGKRLRVRVTASNSFGSETATSEASPVVGDFTNTAPPAVLGEPVDQVTLDSTTGSWANQPADFARQWLRCSSDDVASCQAIAGATGQRYTLTTEDVGSFIRIRVTPQGFGVGGPATSNPAAGPVTAAPPVNVQAPVISGRPRRGQLLGLSSTGVWTGTPPLLFTYQWQRCTGADPATCADIPGATGLSYQPKAADVGQRLRAHVTVDNAAPGPGVTAATALTGRVAAGSRAARRMTPFPVVAFGGRLTRFGAALTLVRVSGPRGARVRLRCRGGGCPFGRARRMIGRKRVLRVHALERPLSAGTVLVVLVTKPGTIGKYTRYRIRLGKAPRRRDACLRPGSTRPRACPT